FVPPRQHLAAQSGESRCSQPRVFQSSAIADLKAAIYSYCMLFDERPWGSFTVLDEAADYKVKRIEVLPNKRLSYQRHEQRSEHWMVVAGQAKVTLDGRETTVGTGGTIDVPVGAAHRIENIGKEKLVFID